MAMFGALRRCVVPRGRASLGWALKALLLALPAAPDDEPLSHWNHKPNKPLLLKVALFMVIITAMKKELVRCATAIFKVPDCEVPSLSHTGTSESDNLHIHLAEPPP